MLKGISPRVKSMSAKLSNEDLELVKAYMLGAINDFCKNNKNEAFSIRIMFGEDNADWRKTPMQKIYDYHINNGKSHDEARKIAGQDAGHLLKRILNDDDRTFEFVGKDSSNKYKLDR